MFNIQFYERLIAKMSMSMFQNNVKNGFQAKDVMKDLLGRLDEAIDDMEQGRVQTIEEAWAEIDAI